MEVSIDISKVKESLDKLDWTQNVEAMRFAATEIMRLTDDYVPFEQGMLKNTAFITPMGDAIIYPMPYAQYLYNGMLMVDPITKKGSFYDPITNRHWSRPGVQKELTTTPLHFAGEPKRGAHWAERAWNDYGDQVCRAIERYIERNLL